MTSTLCKMLARTNWALSYIFLRKKSIFDRPTIIRVQVWPSNSKTRCSWSCNFQNRLYLTIRLFWRVVLLKLTTPSSGATYHLLFLSSLSSFSLSSPFLCSGTLGRRQLFSGGCRQAWAFAPACACILYVLSSVVRGSQASIWVDVPVYSEIRWLAVLVRTHFVPTAGRSPILGRAVVGAHEGGVGKGAREVSERLVWWIWNPWRESSWFCQQRGGGSSLANGD